MKDGTYIKTESGEIVDYAVKWAYGYIVGVQAIATVGGLDGELLGDGGTDYLIEAHIRSIPAHNLFGVWTDSDGTVYIDYVEHVGSLSVALSKARERGELAVWDLRNEREIRV